MSERKPLLTMAAALLMLSHGVWAQTGGSPVAPRDTSVPASSDGTAHANTLVVVAEFFAKPDQVDAFSAAIDRHAANSRKEQEMLAFDVAQDPLNPAHFTLWEVFVDAEARIRHRKLPSSLEFWPIVTPLLVRQTDGMLYIGRELRRRPQLK